MDRRLLMARGALLGGAVVAPASRVWAQGAAAAAIITRDGMRPQMALGIQSGDPKADGAVIWTRSDRPARLWLEWATTASFANATRVRGPHMLEGADFTGRVDLTRLPAGQAIVQRVVRQDLHNERVLAEPLQGHLHLPPAATHRRTTRDVRFVWSGDTAEQGWGINEAWGGMKIYEQMRKTNPGFFLHCGDSLCADGPLSAQVKRADGRLWNNGVTEEVNKVAETLNGFRGRYRYNPMDAKDLSDDKRHTGKNIPLLVARATKAFNDTRSCRSPNTANLQTSESADTVFMGQPRLDWLLDGLKRSKAVWKVIAADLPLGLHVADGKEKWEAIANGDNGTPRGRELELAGLLRAIKRAGIRNVVWRTADVHCTSARHFDPAQAAFSDFSPFREFVSGPLNAGGFGPNKADTTFGMQVVYRKASTEVNAPPTHGLRFFGQVDIDARTRAMTVALKDLAGAWLYSKTLAPQRG